MPFIVLEGLDGAGKSTQLAKLKNFLSDRKEKVEYLHFPRFDTPFFGELIARFLRGEFGTLEEVDPYLVALLFAGDRADAAPMMKKWLDKRKAVITDRFVYSNVAFQCAKLDDPEKREKLKNWIIDLEFEHNALPHPDASIFLDVPFEFTEKRLRNNRSGSDRKYLGGGRDIHEDSLELQKRVRKVYISLSDRDEKFHVVDCCDASGQMDTPDRIFERIKRIVEPILEHNRLCKQ